ncbi:MAG: TIGR03668 family PPOX class F420-dependent oxidoreductase [Actinobacteria bacterium]|nr:TIGR03668 family PPOX class F420-dependent oxidoreductase [Actinomycetota bacterium]
MQAARARALVDEARIARLATTTRTGRIDLVPITFALVDDRLVTAVDHKPKTTTHLKRLENIAVNPEVSVLVDGYDDADWSKLWWVRLRGLAQVIDDGAVYESALDVLTSKYHQYADVRPAGPAIVVELIRWQWWSASA